MDEQKVRPDPFATGKIELGASAGKKVGGGRFCLERILGRGGMGIVWLARDERLAAQVALKFLPSQIRYDATALDDLRRETARSRELTHPNIIRIHDLYEAAEEDAFISMEYIDGRNLAELRVEQATRVFTWGYLKPLVEQLCAGLHYAHGEGIIHRDLKAANLMVDSKGRLKLADFGIARTVSDTLGRNALSHTSGTVLYMSPQQMEGDVPRAADDIYALGATLYELLTGKPPFYTGNILHQVRNVPPRPMRDRLVELGLTNDIPPEVEQVILSCLAKNTWDRPQSAAEIPRLLTGSKLKLMETQHQLLMDTKHRQTERRAQEIAFTTAAKSSRRWQWLTAAVFALGIGLGIWLLAPATKISGRSSKAAPMDKVESVAPSPAPPVVPVEAASPPPKAKAAQPIAQGKTPIAALRLEQEPAPKKVAPPESQSASTPEFVAVVSTNSAPAVQIAKVSPTGPSLRATTAASATTPPAATALQLLHKANTHVTARSKDRVLQISCGRTAAHEPPQSWRFLYYDDKTTYNAVEVRFEAGAMERIYEPNRFLDLFSVSASKTLDVTKLKTDSNQAIRIALAECEAAGASANFIELKLARGYGGLPVWTIKLFGPVSGKSAPDAALGYVIVLADDGRVLKKEISVKNEKVAAKK